MTMTSRDVVIRTIKFQGAGHRPEALDAMSDKFVKLSREHGWR